MAKPWDTSESTKHIALCAIPAWPTVLVPRISIQAEHCGLAPGTHCLEDTGGGWLLIKLKLYMFKLKELVEPVFGIIKEQMGARRLLLRGLANVMAELALLATAFNLRTLCRHWKRPCGLALTG